ncbi:MAG: hypothetical protein JNJ58_13335 [Chitinophagaceae bacterium]|nr:hypothetical protein [Chitinophagaceae bacterium]
MSKKNKPAANHPLPHNIPTDEKLQGQTESTVQENSSFVSKLTTGWIPYLIFTLFGLALYANTFHHEFALDDEIIICENIYVLKGIDGIGEIMQHDIFDSYNQSLNSKSSLAGGRFRPFSLATFAIEQEFIGTLPNGIQPDSWDLNQNKIGDANEDINHDGLFNSMDVKVKGMGMRHVVNVLLYILCISILFRFLSTYFFKDKPLLAFLTALLFLAHPIHTEVVANVKSRDEILSLMFMILTLHLSFKYVANKKITTLLLGLLAYFIALLSKEYGVTLLIILPAAIYVYHKDFKWSSVPQLWIGLLVSFGIYYFMRSQVTLGLNSDLQDNELMNNPYLYASATQAWATKIFIHLKYFILLLAPTTMSCDYGFDVIAFRTFSSPEVWLSILILLVLSAATIYSFIKRHWLLFPLLFLGVHLILINNFVFNIGATMGERLVFHSSLGVCILLIYGLHVLFTRTFKWPSYILMVVLLPVLLLYSIKTISRNAAWKNNTILYATDVATYPKSTMLNANSGRTLFDLSTLPANATRKAALLDSAYFYGRRAYALHPNFFTNLKNLGVVKVTQGDMDSAAFYWKKAIARNPQDVTVSGYLDNAAGYYYNKGTKYFDAQKLDSAMQQFLLANEIKPKDHRPLYFLGMIYFKQGNMTRAKEMWSKGLLSAPNDAMLQQALRSIP